ncbi:porin [Marinimicrobium agarilyticum]|uniref:porin n=1 Tax=Marinimicrobium agarilyticum TaxID=306546 RepID=UPI000412CDBC|nr:porin [Marinimicrobium agarilyticum]
MKRFHTLILGLTVLVLPIGAISASANPDSSSWSVNGFGTLGVVRSDEEQADFTSGLLADEGAGYSDQWSAKVDSKVGVQLTSNFASKFQAVLQVVSEQGHDGSFDPQVEWANVSYKATPNLTVRLGRTVLPTFMASEYRKVGYAMPTVRPAAEVYNLVPITNSDGIDIIYKKRFGEITNALHFLYGQKNTDLPDGFDINADNAFTLANTLEWKNTTLFASYSQADLTTEVLNSFFESFRAFGPEGERLADRFDLNETTVHIASVGVRYDPGDWFVTSEWTNSRSRSFIGEHQGWYATGGVRIKALTPYLTVADLQAKGALSHPGLPIPQAEPLNRALNQLLQGNTSDQMRLAIGARWDFSPSMALKIQYDHIDLRRGTRGVLSNTQPGFEGNEPVGLFSTTIDFVF